MKISVKKTLGGAIVHSTSLAGISAVKAAPTQIAHAGSIRWGVDGLEDTHERVAREWVQRYGRRVESRLQYGETASLATLPGAPLGAQPTLHENDALMAPAPPPPQQPPQQQPKLILKLPGFGNRG